MCLFLKVWPLASVRKRCIVLLSVFLNFHFILLRLDMSRFFCNVLHKLLGGRKMRAKRKGRRLFRRLLLLLVLGRWHKAVFSHILKGMQNMCLLIQFRLSLPQTMAQTLPQGNLVAEEYTCPVGSPVQNWSLWLQRCRRGPLSYCGV